MTNKPETRESKTKKPRKRDRKPREIGTNVGRAILEAQARQRDARGAQAAAIARKIAGGAK